MTECSRCGGHGKIETTMDEYIDSLKDSNVNPFEKDCPKCGGIGWEPEWEDCRE